MKGFRKWLVLLLSALIAVQPALAHQNDTTVGRLQLVHPDLGHEGGSALHTKIRNLYTRIADHMSSRYVETTGAANSSVTVITHNLNIPFADTLVVLYSGVGASKTRVADPAGAGWTIAANGTNPRTQIDVTAPSSGGPHSFTVVITDGLKSMAVQAASAVAITGGTIAGTVITTSDHDGGTATNSSRFTLPKATKTTLDALTRKEGTVLYATDLDRVYYDDGTVLQEVGSGSGQGELNVITNPSASAAITGWTASGAGITVARTTTTTDLPLGPLITTAIKVTPVSGTDYVYTRWTQPTGLKQRKLKLEWFQRPLSGYATGDLKVEVYKHSDVGTCTYSGGSYTEYALSTDSSGTSSIPNQTGKYTTYFDADDADCFEARVVRVAGTTALNLAAVVAGPGIQPQGAVVGEWLNYTPTYGAGFGTVTTTWAQYRRVGDTMELRARFTVGTVTGGEATITIPGGFTVSSPTANNHLVGRAAHSGTNEEFLAVSDGSVANNTKIFFYREGIDPYSGSPAVGNDFTSSGSASMIAAVKVSEWSGSGTLNVAQNDVFYGCNSTTSDTDDTTSFAYGPAGCLLPGTLTQGRTKDVDLGVIQPNDEIMVEVQIGGGTESWLVLDGHMNTGPVHSCVTQNTGAYGFCVRRKPGSTTTVTMQFNQYAAATGATFGAAGTAWGSVTAGSRYRVKKVAGGAAVGFGHANTTQAGLVSTQTQSFAGDKTFTGDTAVGTASGSPLIDAAPSACTTPGYGFTGDTGTGWTRSANDTLDVCIAGVSTVSFGGNFNYGDGVTYNIQSRDSAGSDDSRLNLAGGGSASASRGAYIELQGDDFGGVTVGGDINLVASDNASAEISLAEGGGTVGLKVTAAGRGEVNAREDGSGGIGNVYSGRFTCADDGHTNVGAGLTCTSGHFIRVGDVVTYSVRIQAVDVTTTGNTAQFRITVPVASATFSAATEAAGTCVTDSTSNVTSDAWNISASGAASSSVLIYTGAPVDGGSRDIYCHVTFSIP